MAMSKYSHPVCSPYVKRNPVGLFHLIQLREQRILPENYFIKHAQRAIICDGNRRAVMTKRITSPDNFHVAVIHSSEVDMVVARFYSFACSRLTAWPNKSSIVMFDLKHESIRRVPFCFPEVQTAHVPAPERNSYAIERNGQPPSSVIIQTFSVTTPNTFLEPGYPREMQVIVTKSGALFVTDRNGKQWESEYISRETRLQDAYYFQEHNRLILVGDIANRACQEIHIFELFPLKILVKFHLPTAMTIGEDIFPSNTLAGKIALCDSTYFVTESPQHNLHFYDLESVLKPPVLNQMTVRSVFPVGFPINADIVENFSSVRKMCVPVDNVASDNTESHGQSTNTSTSKSNNSAMFRGGKLYSMLSDAKMHVVVFQYPKDQENVYRFFNIDLTSDEPSMQKIYEATALVLESYSEAANSFIILSTEEIHVVRFHSDTLAAEILFSWKLSADAATNEPALSRYGRPLRSRLENADQSQLLNFSTSEECCLLCLLILLKDTKPSRRVARIYDLATFELLREVVLFVGGDDDGSDPYRESATLHKGRLWYHRNFTHPGIGRGNTCEDTLFEFCEGEHKPKLVSARIVELMQMSGDFFP